MKRFERWFGMAAAVVFAAMATGCATSRGEMRLAVPEAGVERSDGRPVFIDEITDARRWEDKPAEPSTPSLKGGASNASAEVKARAVARKRNTYGMALGDILLEGDQTVTGLMRDLLARALAADGYRIVDSRDALGEDGLEIDVRIEKFWGWFTPGFFSVSMEAQVETALRVSEGGATRDVAVRAYGINKGQSGREANWIEAYDRAFEDYRNKVQAAF